ncbi:MAG: histidine phosphatase family protein [Armatimonadetes bacterium]|nr:histidine phosphatase family protein [Anaerolineae bacterium]
MPPLLLVKHSLPEIVPQQPANEWHLSVLGRRRCITLAEHLRIFKPDMIISSREPKASETGQLVAARLALPFSEADDLHEHERRNEQFSGQATFHANIRAFFTQPDKLLYGTETANQAYDRFSAAVTNIQRTHAGKLPMIVAHGTVIALYVARQSGLDGFALWGSLGMPSFIAFETDSAQVIASVHDLP